MANGQFRRDLYRGTARDYDRFRVPYPRSLADDLAARSGAAGQGRLLDLACGTGQLSFAMQGCFAETWAVDQEPGMISLAKAKAELAGISSIRFAVSAAEELRAPEQSFDLVAIGNAFHRLPRAAVAASVFRWLRPGRFLALVWGGSPWEGDAPWQQTMSAVMQRWRIRAGVADRIPAGYEQARMQRPDLVILREAGFQPGGRYQFSVAHEWTPDTLVGFAYSTSVLCRAALGRLAPDFGEDLGRVLGAYAPDGRLRQVIRFAYDLARRPA